jgi:Fe-S oxidoreductase
MAKLKYEFENQYYKTHRRSLRDYVFGYFHFAAKLGSSMAPFVNAVTQIPVLKSSVANVLGVTPQRPFPRFATRTKVSNIGNPNGKKIFFLSDPIARYVEPQVEQAALDILAKCGYDIHILPILGAGASLLSKGFVDAAKHHAGKVLDALNQIDPVCEAAIVGIEPPEIYTLKNDYRDLLPDRVGEIASRAAHTWLLDEYLLRSDKFLKFRVGNILQSPNITTTSAGKIYFHPHCHQRAEGLALDGFPCGTSATVELLRVCGYEVELLETGCCGMAGTFGYEAEHYNLSMQVGELNLFPILRQVKIKYPKAEIVATGAACRMQIAHGVDLDSRHSIELVRESIL